MKLIAAVTNGNIIGYKGGMPWPHSREDMARFRALTMGQKVIMGRKSWESLPKKFRPLPGRENIVVTRDDGYRAPGAKKYTSLEQALDENPEAWIIGGGEIYRQSLDRITEFHVSFFPGSFEGDTLLELPLKGTTIEKIDICSDHIYMRIRK